MEAQIGVHSLNSISPAANEHLMTYIHNRSSLGNVGNTQANETDQNQDEQQEAAYVPARSVFNWSVPILYTVESEVGLPFLNISLIVNFHILKYLFTFIQIHSSTFKVSKRRVHENN
jgi:hypothetical protein